MGPGSLFVCLFRRPVQLCVPRRHLLTLAIETSCDDTSVAVLEKHKDNSATLHFNSKITSDNRSFGGVYPVVAHESHQKNIAALVKEALQSLPLASPLEDSLAETTLPVTSNNGRTPRKKPDFITVTRGPGMRASLITGVDTAKGLAVAWQIPLLGVNHMQAHALTPRLVAALDVERAPVGLDPAFPFLTLLVSGGHTMLVHSKELCNHQIIANTTDIAIGDMLDKAARDILPPSLIETAPDVMYGPLLERFAFEAEEKDQKIAVGQAFHGYYDKGRKNKTVSGNDWKVNAPYARSGPKGPSSHSDSFSFSGIGSSAKRIIEANPSMGEIERKELCREVMQVSFEHLASRVLLALKTPEVKETNTLVVSGGVASNQYLKHVLRTLLDRNGYRKIGLIFPPPKYCTDNAAMIAWTGIEMFEAGWRTHLNAMAVRQWSIDPREDDGGILGLDGWQNVGVH